MEKGIFFHFSRKILAQKQKMEKEQKFRKWEIENEKWNKNPENGKKAIIWKIESRKNKV